MDADVPQCTGVGGLSPHRIEGKKKPGHRPGFFCRRYFGYLKEKLAVCVVPSISFTWIWRQVPAHDFSLFHT